MTRHIVIPNNDTLRDFVFAKLIIKNGCWEWNGGKNSDGYPCVCLNGKQYRVSRVIYAYTYTDPGKLIVRHTCDNPSCVNPDHLIAGTTQDNIDDKVSRGRAKGAHSGEQHHNAILTDKQVEEIRKVPNVYGSGRRLAKKYGVSESTISNIRSKVRRT